MWIHLLTLGLIDGAGGNPTPPVILNEGHFAEDHRAKKYKEERELLRSQIEALFQELKPSEELEQVKAEVKQQIKPVSKSAVSNEEMAFVAYQIETLTQIVLKLEQMKQEEDDEIAISLLL